MHTRHLVRTVEAGRYLGLSASTLEKFRVQGGGPAFTKVGAKIVVYDIADLNAWLDARKKSGTETALVDGAQPEAAA
jgi:predicted DNA-binding transcriptional regulator AlpA